jgi:hypothetical protein
MVPSSFLEMVARLLTAGSHSEAGAHINFGGLCSGLIPHHVPDPIVGQQTRTPQGHRKKGHLEIGK